MKSIYVVALLAALSCCAHSRGNHEQADAPTVDDLKRTSATYQQALNTAALEVNGWVAQNCDALLFSSLYGAALSDPSVVKIDVAAVPGVSGKWLRRDPALGTCEITISKDMLLGLTYYAWRAKRVDIMQAMTDYGLAHGWVMGEPHETPDELSKVVVTPALAGLMYQVLYKLGGKDHPSRHLPDIFPAGLTGFEAHLQVTSILLHGEVDDDAGISDEMLARLQEHAAANPKNPYYAVALARYSGEPGAAIALLGDSAQWPPAALPGPENHCQGWPVQRDDGDTGWLPCDKPEDGIFYGADFVWMVDLLTRPRRAD